jgi:hypothetical protein
MQRLQSCQRSTHDNPGNSAPHAAKEGSTECSAQGPQPGANSSRIRAETSKLRPQTCPAQRQTAAHTIKQPERRHPCDKRHDLRFDREPGPRRTSRARQHQKHRWHGEATAQNVCRVAATRASSRTAHLSTDRHAKKSSKQRRRRQTPTLQSRTLARVLDSPTILRSLRHLGAMDNCLLATACSG